MQQYNSGNKRQRRPSLALALLLCQLLCLASIAASADHARGPSFTAVGVLSSSEDYDPHTGQYFGIFPLLVNNSGQTTGTGVLHVAGLPDGWTWDIVEGQSILEMVEPGTVVRVTVHVRALGPDPGEYPFQVVIEPGPAIVPFDATVPFLGALDLSTTETVQGGTANPALVLATATNLANGPDSFELKVFLPTPDWWYAIDGSPVSSVVPMSGSHTWNITIHVPYSAEATAAGGAGYKIWFKAVSQGDSTVNAMNYTQLKVDRHRGLHLDIRDKLLVQQERGSVVTIDAVLENDGNAPEQVSLSADVPAFWSVQIPSSEREMPPFERVPISLYVSPPANTTNGRYTVSFTAHTADGAHQAQADVVVEVPAESVLSLVPGGQSGEPPVPGQSARYDLMVRNGGNHLELVEMRAFNVPDGWSVTFYPSVVSLPQGASAQLQAMVQTSRDPLGSLAGPHSFGVLARSLYTRTEATLPVEIEVKGVTALELFSEGAVRSANPALDPDPVYIFRLRNSGNIGLTASLLFSSAEGVSSWLQPSRQAISVSPGDVATFHVAVSPSPDARPADYNFRVTAMTGAAGAPSMSSDFIFKALSTDISVQRVQGRGPGSTIWSDEPKLIEGQELELGPFLLDKGTDRADSIELSIYSDGRYLYSFRTFGAPSQSIVWAVPCKVRPSQGWHNLSIRISAPGDRNTDDNEASLRVFVSPAPVPVRETAAAAGAVATTGAVLMAAIMLNEGWKFKALLLFIVPLYTRLRSEATLDNFTRGRIYGYIEANPGEHYNAIKKALELPNGSLAHHLDTLMREGFVRSEPDGNYKRFYPSHMRTLRGKAADDPGRVTRIQQIILDAVIDEPGISQRQISRLLNLSPSTINYHIRIMATSGLLRLERSLGRTLCYAGAKAPADSQDLEEPVEEEAEP